MIDTYKSYRTETKESKYKLQRLEKTIKGYGKVIVAFSGGADSTFLLKMCKDLLGKNVIAVIGKSESYPSRELFSAKKNAEDLNAEYLIVETKELNNPDYSSNPSNRCYYCKKELFTRIKSIAFEKGIKIIVEGSNYDDLSDYRPGMRAASDMEIFSPLKDAGLTKEEIRMYSKKMGLSTWDKPARPCLSSRLPYGTSITSEKLKMVEQAETCLEDMGFRQYRVRYHTDIARIEIPVVEFTLILDEKVRQIITTRLKEIGFTYITIDIEGFRSSSMNL